MNLPATQAARDITIPQEDKLQLVVVYVDDQMFGLPVLKVHDVLRPFPITHIPHAPSYVAGSLNLRGRIVTAIDMRVKLGLAPTDLSAKKWMHIVVEQKNEFYSLIVDHVGDVMTLSLSDFEKSPATLQENWRKMLSGVFRLDQELLLLFDPDLILNDGGM